MEQQQPILPANVQADKNVHYNNQIQSTEHKKNSIWGESRGKIDRRT
jgi:hypothetical protein